MLPDLDPILLFLYKLQSHTTDPRACEKRIWTLLFSFLFIFFGHFSTVQQLFVHFMGWAGAFLDKGMSGVLGGKSGEKKSLSREVVRTFIECPEFIRLNLPA